MKITNRIIVTCFRFYFFGCFLSASSFSSEFSIEEPWLISLREILLHENADIAGLEAQYSIKYWQNMQNWARVLPRIDLQLTNNHSQDFSILTSGSLGNLFPATFQPPKVNLYAWNLSLQFPIFKMANYIPIAISSKEMASLQLQISSKKESVLFQFYQILSAWCLENFRFQINSKNKEILDSNENEIKLKVRLGKLTNLDALKIKVQKQQLESQLSQIEYQARIQENQLSLLLKLAKDDDLLSKVKAQWLATKKMDFNYVQKVFAVFSYQEALNRILRNTDEQYIRDTILRNNIDIKIAANDLEVTQAKADNIMSGEYPDLFLKASLTKQTQDTSTLFDGNYQTQALLFSLSLPLFTGGTLVSTFFERKDQIKNALLKKDFNGLQIVQSGLNEFSHLSSLAKQEESLEGNLNELREIASLTYKNYQLGRSTLSEYLTSQQNVLDGELSWVTTLKEKSDSKRRLYQLLGGNL